MSEAPSLEELARRFLDLWQDQVAALAADPQAAAQWQQQWQQMMAAGIGMAGAAWTGVALDGSADSAAPAGAAPAAAASRDGGDGPAELALRLAALERRLAALESGAVAVDAAPAARGAGKKPRAKPGTRKRSPSKRTGRRRSG